MEILELEQELSNLHPSDEGVCNHKFTEFVEDGDPTCIECGLMGDNKYISEFGYRGRCMMIVKESSYTRYKYFEETLQIFLCYKDPPSSVKDFASTLPTNITKSQVREEIKRNKKTGFNRYVRAIYHLATGEKPPYVSTDGIHHDFQLQEIALKDHCKHRKNSTNVWYKMYKLFQHNKVTVDVEDFPLPGWEKVEEYEANNERGVGKVVLGVGTGVFNNTIK